MPYVYKVVRFDDGYHVGPNYKDNPSGRYCARQAAISKNLECGITVFGVAAVRFPAPTKGPARNLSYLTMTLKCSANVAVTPDIAAVLTPIPSRGCPIGIVSARITVQPTSLNLQPPPTLPDCLFGAPYLSRQPNRSICYRLFSTRGNNVSAALLDQTRRTARGD
jgi:hypothetical protein